MPLFHTLGYERTPELPEQTRNAFVGLFHTGNLGTRMKHRAVIPAAEVATDFW
jgi:hypothetical protein